MFWAGVATGCGKLKVPITKTKTTINCAALDPLLLRHSFYSLINQETIFASPFSPDWLVRNSIRRPGYCAGQFSAIYPYTVERDLLPREQPSLIRVRPVSSSPTSRVPEFTKRVLPNRLDGIISNTIN